MSGLAWLLVFVVTCLLSVESYQFSRRYDQLHPPRDSFFHRLIYRRSFFEVAFTRESDAQLRLLRRRLMLSIAAWVASFLLLMLSPSL